MWSIFMSIDNTLISYPPCYPARVKQITTTSKTPAIPQGRDTFETPNYAVDLLIPFIPKDIERVWECAAGGGRIANRLEHYGYHVDRSDIRGYDGKNMLINFLEATSQDLPPNDYCIITNPPYSIKEMFIDKAFLFGYPFAFLINADYSGLQISWIKRGCEKIIPNRRIDFITPTGRQGKTSASQFHSMWLTYGFGLGRTETFVDLPLQAKKDNI
jgi:hypothetical protein